MALLQDDQRVLPQLAQGTCRAPTAGLPALEPRAEALVHIGALIALAASPAIPRAVEDALEAGATPDDVIAALIAVSTTVGEARLVASTPAVALALGYDLDDAFER